MKYELDPLINILNAQRPFDSITAKSIRDHLVLEYNQQSNAIEENSLTLNETKVLLQNGITANGKPFKDHLDIINHQSAIIFLEDIVKDKKPLSETIIKDFNYLLLKGTKDETYGGRFRKIPVWIEGSAHTPPQPYLVQSRMENLLQDYNNTINNQTDKIALIAKFHAEFTNIHPFVDGNGRTARLIMNFELMKNDYPLTIISASDRVSYYNALAKADKGDFSDIKHFISDNVKRNTIKILDTVCPDWKKIYSSMQFKKKCSAIKQENTSNVISINCNHKNKL